MSTESGDTKFLSSEEVARFHRTGYLGPYSITRRSEIGSIRRHVRDSVFASEGVHNTIRDRHRDDRLVYEIATDPAIVGRVRSILGDELLLYHTKIWSKSPGDGPIPWHQERAFWEGMPVDCLFVWIAITDAVRENGGLQFQAGAHDILREHEPTDDDQETFPLRLSPEHVDEAAVERMDLQPGEFTVFTERTPHYSPPNTSDRDRIGMVVRFVRPFADLDQEEKLYPEHKMINVSADHLGPDHPRVVTPPAE
jgi:ectoine hydroxylase-related dioxygenase (phytanoyl-CoA dioxygenase family)